MQKTKNWFLGIERSEKRDPVFAIDYHIEFPAKTEYIIKRRKRVDSIKSASADNSRSIYHGVRRMLPVVGRENRDCVSASRPPFGEFVNVYFRSSGINIFNIPPIKNQDSFLARSRIRNFRDRPKNSRDIPDISSDAFEGGAEKLRG